MPRIAKVVIEGVLHHIAQRGNARQTIFFHERDYLLYLDHLNQYRQDAHLRILAYCLMPNHIHLIAIPDRPSAMASTPGRTHASYARYYNLEKRSCGHVWRARYYSTPMDTPHLWQAMAYVERNPVRGGLVQHAAQYPWSSARQRLRQTVVGPQKLIDLALWYAEYDPSRWEQALATSVNEEAFGQRLQHASQRGRPLGDTAFVEELEKLSGRRLRPLSTGPSKRSSPTHQEEPFSRHVTV